MRVRHGGGSNMEMQAICTDFMATLMPCLNRRACSTNMVSGWEMQMQICNERLQIQMCAVWKMLTQIPIAK